MLRQQGFFGERVDIAPAGSRARVLPESRQRAKSLPAIAMFFFHSAAPR